MDLINKRAELAKSDQAKVMADAKTALEAYWAGSATASFVNHYRRGAVVTVRAGKKR